MITLRIRLIVARSHPRGPADLCPLSSAFPDERTREIVCAENDGWRDMDAVCANAHSGFGIDPRDDPRAPVQT